MAAQQNEILIHLGQTGWLATYQGPHAKRIGELFDTCTLPTAFTAEAPLAVVLAAVASTLPPPSTTGTTVNWRCT